jgi:predicted short-subunit dehydrogenase-like oxidoreductase (DUF2520 family)
VNTVSILGLGRAGGALAIALSRAGVPIENLVFHSKPVDLPGVEIDQVAYDHLDSLASDVLIVATPDPDISNVAAKIAEFQVLPKVALHLSGSLSSAELELLRVKGISLGSMHPLVSISDPLLGADRFAGAFFCIEGDDVAVDAASNLVRAVGGDPFTIDTAFKPLYHASAVMASGNVTALFDVAVEMLCACGLERTQAHTVLLPLLQSAVANLSGQSTADALTGPFVRGDLAAFNRHLRAFEGAVDDDLKRIYLLLAARSVAMMARSNKPETSALADAISVAKQKTGC